MAILLGIALCVASGYLLLSSVWPGGVRRSELWIKFLLSIGFGIGFFSITFVFVCLSATPHVLVTDTCVTAALAAIYVLARTHSERQPSDFSALRDLCIPTRFRSVLIVSFAVSVCAALAASILRAMFHPHGDGWDAFAIWNLHARFLFLGDTNWSDGFSALIPWSHPDYPLMVPAAIAHFWSYLGHDSTAVPAVISLIFAWSSLGLLVTSLVVLRGRVVAMLAGITLASTPFFVDQSAAQYADIPLGFFILASTVLFHLYQRDPSTARDRFLFLAGIAAGFAAWTKNEGLMFLFAFTLAQLIAGRGQRLAATPDGRAQFRLMPFLLGILPMLLVIGWFKRVIASPGDIFSSPHVMLQKILTPARYWIILQWFVKDLLRFGGWVLPGSVLLLLFYLIVPSLRIRHQRPALDASVWTLVLTLAGYFAVYVITPYDLYWHLRFSLSRLFLQLWPTTIFVFFLFVPGQTPQNESHAPPRA